MKALVALACVAVIAFVGYYFWNEHRQGQIEAAAIADRRFQQDCREVVARGGDDTRPSFVTDCLVSGAVTQADLDRAIAKLRQN